MSEGRFDWKPLLLRIEQLKVEEPAVIEEVDVILAEMVQAPPIECEVALKTLSQKTKIPLKTLRQQFSFVRKKQKKTTKSDDDNDWLAVISGDIRGSIVEQFGDFTGDAWVYFDDDDGRHFFSANSTAFEDFVRTQIQRSMGKPLEAWVKPITRLVASESRRVGIKELGVRWTTDENGDWLYQLDQNNILVVTNQGLDVLESKPVFRHYTEQKPVVVDLKASLEDIDLLDDFFNFRDANEYELFKSILPAFLVPDIAKPVMMFTGPPGSAKSTACRFIKILLDPVSGMEYGGEFITKSDQLFVTCLRNQVIISDNVQDPTPAEQDTMSRLSTGLNINARKLYTNNELVSATFRRIQLVNGIQFTNLQADLIDRTLMWELDRVEDDERLFESELFSRFEKVAPRIRGAMFRALWQMRNQPIKQSPELRLVDFARYAVSSGIIFGHDETMLHSLLSDKVNMQKTESLDSSKIAIVLLSWLDHHSKTAWNGSPSELYSELTDYVNGSGQSKISNLVSPKDWYTRSNEMGKELRLIAHHLPFKGWKYEYGRTESARWIKLSQYTIPPPSEILADKRSDAKRFDAVREQILKMTEGSKTVKLEDIYAVTGVVGRKVVASMLEKGELAELRGGEVMRIW